VARHLHEQRLVALGDLQPQLAVDGGEPQAAPAAGELATSTSRLGGSGNLLCRRSAATIAAPSWPALAAFHSDSGVMR
jgi:hypothetical protein